MQPQVEEKEPRTSQTIAVSGSGNVTWRPPSEDWLYVYGIIPTTRRLVFQVPAMDDDDEGVFTISCGDLAVVVSVTHRRDYGQMKREETLRYLVAHQRVIESVMRDFSVLPVKFGTVLTSQDQMDHALAQGQALFRETLNKFSGKVQLEVVILWDLKQVFEEIGQEEAVQKLKAELSARPAAEVLTERAELGRLVQNLLEHRRAAPRDQIVPALRQVACDLIFNPLMDDGMVLNAALLVDKNRQKQLDRCLERLDQQFGGQLTFRRVGPLPPYSFATVEMQAPSFEMLDNARQCLGLGDNITLIELQRAYRQCATRLHPDHNLESADAEAQMAELTRAYHLLSSYMESRLLLLGKKSPHALERRCHVTRDMVERTVLVSVRRQEAAN